MNTPIPERIRDKHPFWGEWVIDGFLGGGSYGQVFSVRKTDESGVYEAALKWIHLRAPEGADPASVEKNKRISKAIQKEIQLLAKLGDNDHIVGYKDHQIIARDDGGRDILIRMEKLISLNAYLRDHVITYREIIQLGIDICEALILCQRVNIVHQDIKPDNIFVSMRGFKLGDFGIAHTIGTASDISRGTLRYMAPEVYAGRTANTCATDLYSLGMVLYHLLNDGRGPFEPSRPTDISKAQEEKANLRRLRGDAFPAPAHGSSRLWGIIRTACAFRSQDRFASADAMKKSLETIQYTRDEAEMIYPQGDRVAPGSLRNLSSRQPEGERAPAAEINVIMDDKREINVIIDEKDKQKNKVKPAETTPEPPGGGEATDDGKRKKIPVWMILAAAAGIAALCAALYFGGWMPESGVAVFAQGKTSLGVRWSGGPGPCVISYAPGSNRNVASKVASDTNEVTLENLIPGTEYRIVVDRGAGQPALTTSAQTARPGAYGKHGTILSRIDVKDYYLADAPTQEALGPLVEKGDRLYDLEDGVIALPGTSISNSRKGYVARVFVTCEETAEDKAYTALYVLKTDDGKRFSAPVATRAAGSLKEYCLYSALNALLDMYYEENFNEWVGTKGTVDVYADGDYLAGVSFTLSA